MDKGSGSSIFPDPDPDPDPGDKKRPDPTGSGSATLLFSSVFEVLELHSWNSKHANLGAFRFREFFLAGMSRHLTKELCRLLQKKLL